MVLPKRILKSILPFFLLQQAQAQASGSGTTTRYWDCCKASCGWSGKLTLASGSNPVASCDINDNPLTDYNVQSGCNGGSAYMCTDQTPWAVSDSLSYGFAATTISGGSESSWCCACYQLTFTSGAVAGKQMIVQATNTGGDLGSNQFDIAMPGGGFGIFNGCTAEWGTPSSGWGAQYGGVSSRSQCDSFPDKLKAGCYWRFDWFENADNPAVTFKQVACPKAITDKSGCVRANDAIDETPTGDSATTPASSSSSSIKASTSTTSSTSSSVKPSTSATSLASSLLKAISSTTSSTTSSSASTSTGATSAKWGQCGGIGWSGATACAAGSTCTYSNPWYSQCL